MKSTAMSIIAPIIFFTSITAAGQSTATYSLPEQWEYRITLCFSESDLNKFGAEGWELVSAKLDSNGHCNYIFKRPKGVVVSITPPPPSPSTPSCSLALAQAPVIYGVRLGMSTDELLELFPRSKDNPDIKRGLAQAEIQYGSTQLLFSRNSFPDGKAFVNNKVSDFIVNTLDSRVVQIRVQYSFPANTNWNSDTWIDKISQPFNLPPRENWLGGSFNSERSLVCRGFSAGVYAYNDSTSLTIKATNPSSDDVVKERRNAEADKKRREFIP